MSTEPLGLTPAQMEQLRAELGVRRQRRPWLILAALAVAVLAAAGGYLAGHAHPRVEVRSVAHTIQVRSAPKIETRYRTRTASKDVVDPDVVPCTIYQGRLLVFPDSFSTGDSPVQACAVSPVPPYASGVQKAQAADGQTVDFTVEG